MRQRLWMRRLTIRVVFAGAVGFVIGLVLAVVPVFVMMEMSFRATGYDAGNGGILLCCTVPTLPIFGALAGIQLVTKGESL